MVSRRSAALGACCCAIGASGAAVASGSAGAPVQYGGSSSQSSAATITSSPPSYSSRTWGALNSSITAGCSANCGFEMVGYMGSSWSKWITPVTVGTVLVVIDGNNHTSTTTKYDTVAVVSGSTTDVSDLLKTGGLYTATATTMTADAVGFDEKKTPVAYPTQYYDVPSTISWGGQMPWKGGCSTWGKILATTSAALGGAPWDWSLAASPMPTHPPWSTALDPIDPEDPFGRFWTLVDVGQDFLATSNIHSLFPSATNLVEIYSLCTPAPAAAPAVAAHSVAALLATSTERITGGESTTADPVHASDTQKPPTKPTKPTGDASPTPKPTKSTTAVHVSHTVVAHHTTSAPGSDDECTTAIGCFVNTGLGGKKTTVQQTDPLATGSSVGNSGGITTQYVVGGQTLQPGTTVVVSGATLSINPSQSGIYVNGQLTSAPSNPGNTPFTVGSVPITPTAVATASGSVPAYSGPVATTGDGVRPQTTPLWTVSLSLMSVIILMALA